MKKVIALLLTVLRAFSAAVPAFAAESQDLPIIFVAGKRVKIIGRCYGGSILLSYLSKCVNEKIETAIFYVLR